jgi:farnesyl-diphosphate farnesyltransferase
VNGDLRYCRAALPRVSRTFAINIRLLGSPLRDWVSIAYLLCRSADALEDSWPGDGLGERFDRFAAALDGDPGAARSLADSAARVAADGADLDLVAHLPLVLGAFRGLPEPARAAAGACVHTLSAGMRRYAVRGAEQGRDHLYLDDEAEARRLLLGGGGLRGRDAHRSSTPSPTARRTRRRRRGGAGWPRGRARSPPTFCSTGRATFAAAAVTCRPRGWVRRRAPGPGGSRAAGVTHAGAAARA